MTQPTALSDVCRPGKEGHGAGEREGAEGGGRAPSGVGHRTTEMISRAADLRGSLYERLNSLCAAVNGQRQYVVQRVTATANKMSRRQPQTNSSDKKTVVGGSVMK